MLFVWNFHVFVYHMTIHQHSVKSENNQHTILQWSTLGQRKDDSVGQLPANLRSTVLVHNDLHITVTRRLFTGKNAQCLYNDLRLIS
jgi:hypothetical protein